MKLNIEIGNVKTNSEFFLSSWEEQIPMFGISFKLLSYISVSVGLV